jgi:hypothetical protein
LYWAQKWGELTEEDQKLADNRQLVTKMYRDAILVSGFVKVDPVLPDTYQIEILKIHQGFDVLLDIKSIVVRASRDISLEDGVEYVLGIGYLDGNYFISSTNAIQKLEDLYGQAKGVLEVLGIRRDNVLRDMALKIIFSEAILVSGSAQMNEPAVGCPRCPQPTFPYTITISKVYRGDPLLGAETETIDAEVTTGIHFEDDVEYLFGIDSYHGEYSISSKNCVKKLADLTDIQKSELNWASSLFRAVDSDQKLSNWGLSTLWTYQPVFLEGLVQDVFNPVPSGTVGTYQIKVKVIRAWSGPDLVFNGATIVVYVSGDIAALKKDVRYYLGMDHSDGQFFILPKHTIKKV